jgi:hypothetical protein
MRVEKYDSSRRKEWNDFIETSKNGTFLFHRDYMEYHSARFQDYSLLIFDDSGRLIGLMPASLHDVQVVSHGGLTYGGVISDSDMKATAMLEVFDVILATLRRGGVNKLLYKPPPHIFHRMPAEEDLYALFRFNAKLYRRDASSAIWLPDRLKFNRRKRERIRKAKRDGIEVRESNDYKSFFEIGVAVMSNRYNLRPVHSADEMVMLSERFPSNIRLHAAFDGNRMLAGAIVFLFKSAAHIQYMYNSDTGLSVGALDVIIDHLVDHEQYSKLRFLSFGVSTENEGLHLNEGLMNYKEMFGARTVVHDFYELDLT